MHVLSHEILKLLVASLQIMQCRINMMGFERLTRLQLDCMVMAAVRVSSALMCQNATCSHLMLHDKLDESAYHNDSFPEA